MEAYADAELSLHRDSGLAQEPAGEITHEQLQSSFGALRPEQRLILRLVDMHEQTYREAAASLACPIGTVMSRLHRARAALRNQLAQLPQPACA